MDEIYRAVGQLYLNSFVELEKLKEELAREKALAQRAAAERDELLRMMAGNEDVGGNELREANS